MSNKFIKEIPVYKVVEGMIVDHNLYGKGKVIASYEMSGFVDLQFPDGHIEKGYDIKDQIVPQIYKVEAFKCPITDTEILAERCACIKDGIHACDYYKADMEKQASICTYESEMKRIASEKQTINNETSLDLEAKKKAVKEQQELIGKMLEAAKFEDVLGSMKEISAEEINKSVIHKVTGKKGKIEKQVADNAFLVNWKNQECNECPVTTVSTNTEIAPDSDCKLIDKINKLREKFKKFVKPINEFFNKKKASVNEPVLNLKGIIESSPLMSFEQKSIIARQLQKQLRKAGVDIDTNSIKVDESGVYEFQTVEASNDIYKERIPLKKAYELVKSINCNDDILKVYATLQSQLATQTGGYNKVSVNIEGDSELKSLF